MKLSPFIAFWISASLLSHFSVCNAQTAVTADARLSARRIVNAEEQLEALEFILNKTLASAFETYGVSSLDDRAPVMEMRNSLSTNSTHYDFQFRLNRMLNELFHDAHTRVEVESNLDKYRSIDMCLTWVASGELGEESWDLISSCDTDYSQRGDYIVSVGGVTPEALFEMLRRTIPHENDYFLASLEEAWLVREDFLSYFGMLDNQGNVAVVIERDGAVLEAVYVPLLETTSNADDENTPFVSYEILNHSSTAVFKLDDCIFNGTFMAVMTEFWSSVLSNPNIDNVVVDLRANRGGDFSVAPVFLSFISKDSYELFDISQRISDDFCLQTPMLCDPETLTALTSLGANVTDEYMTIPSSVMSAFFAPLIPQSEVTFGGQFSVLTSGTTFSSAHLFAGVVQQNSLGTLVGTPTGNTPSFWGNLISFPVPHTDLTFHLATSQTEGNSIFPDVLIPTTREDILADKDPQLDFIASRNSSGSNTPLSAAMIPGDDGIADDDDESPPETIAPTSSTLDDSHSSAVDRGFGRLVIFILMFGVVLVL
ncbi:Peptidase family S41 [Seminavis robusta]|uniref:Peptidase family S41 n=1 Tax=Seminavis robusta TaxID=568900 RepID=A0A9N8HRT9_9STRA|nr:Peptidase family S41 [Seminavis robusta]|eukprot:Sro1310_g261620.1 Peptidase family S41 (541) ;mRNA; f:10841-12624